MLTLVKTHFGEVLTAHQIFTFTWVKPHFGEIVNKLITKVHTYSGARFCIQQSACFGEILATVQILVKKITLLLTFVKCSLW